MYVNCLQLHSQQSYEIGKLLFLFLNIGTDTRHFAQVHKGAMVLVCLSELKTTLT